MRWTAALLAIVVVACSRSAEPTSHGSATPSQSPQPSQGPSSSSTPTSPNSFDLPLTSVSLSCRLPIATPDGRGAFITFPGRGVAIDPQAHGLPGNGNAYYDRAFSRWLPVGRQAVAADGKHYAFSEPAADHTKNPKIHVVDVTTGADRVFETPSPTWFIAYGVLDFSGDGIYLVQAYESPMFGLWLLNPTTGAMTEVAHLDYIEGSAGNKIFWLGYVDPTDNHNVGTLFSYADQLDRYNIADGSRTPWLHQPGKGISLVAIDAAGHPLVALISSLQSQDAIWALVLLPGPNMQRQIIEARADFVSSLSSSITDGHGVWFGSRQGIYLYSEGGGLQKVSNQPGYPANGCF